MIEITKSDRDKIIQWLKVCINFSNLEYSNIYDRHLVHNILYDYVYYPTNTKQLLRIFGVIKRMSRGKR